MGNLAFMSFNRSVSDEQFTEMLTNVIVDNYNEYYEVIVEKHKESSSWVVQPKNGVLGEEEDNKWAYSLFIYRATDWRKSAADGPYNKFKGKFSHKHMNAGHWGYWFMDQIHGHLSVKYGMKSSDEGCSGTWKIDPAKHPTPEDKLKKNYDYYKNNPELAVIALKETPKRLLKIKN